VAKEFKIHQTILESWLHALSFARNVCAHHQRIWNKTFTIQPKIPKRDLGDWPEGSRASVFSVCAMVHKFMGVIADESQWSRRLYDLIENRPGVPLSRMGFPDNWAKREYWGLDKD
jgi:abortive infection bacteriophage resistance protein